VIIEIKNRFSASVLFTHKTEDDDPMPLRSAVWAASKADANLAGANLAGANLTGADLSGADLSGADLSSAYLTDSYLTGANLAGAYLTGANLSSADLTDSYLTGANLTGANLAGANLAGANLAGAKGLPSGIQASDPVSPYVRAVDSSAADQASRYRGRHPDVPVVDRLDARILSAIDAGGTLRMSDWHTCKTTHCRAGWAITLAGEAGHQLEIEHGPARAGAMIYRASTGRVPWFYDPSDEHALADIKRCAAEQTPSSAATVEVVS
jgi:hypothetical protein